MKKEEFYEILVDALELEDVAVNEGTVFAELEDYDSMAVMSIIAMADEHFEKKFSSEQLRNMKSVADLMDMIGKDQFED